ncbi:DUF192 domain-containing protein [Paracoccus methylarcula]|uniref:DUF192 domain-containing protein n=1 Tax=Paracoccus methylarcula TaxID=72022 RepID=UPI001FEBF4B1|nr:DUF192 domain-containing protein [Paracoccus methylarcula]
MRPNRTTAAPLPLACLIASLAFHLPAAAEPSFACADDRAAILTGRGIVDFDVEIADSSEERARGLMFRKTLPSGSGMLFVYDKPRQVAFWMRNTFIPLDLVFMDATGTIRHIHPDARPFDETPIPGAVTGDPHPERQLILEIGGGEATRLGLAPGQPMATSQLDQEKAAWPCG